MFLKTVLFVAAATICGAASIPPEPGLPICRVDQRPGTCQHTTHCRDLFNGECAWYYCNRGYQERWIDCGTKGCTYLNGEPACHP